MKTPVATLMLTAVCVPVVLAQAALVREAALARVPLARSVASDPEVLQALRGKNASGESLAEIRRKDADWTANAQHPLRRRLSSGPCAQRLRDLTQAEPMVTEVILMDARGANVCISRETSDYWQGDEEKFQKPYQEGHDIFMGEAAFDQSTGVYALQISALVWDGDAKAGALTLSLRVRRQELKGR